MSNRADTAAERWLPTYAAGSAVDAYTAFEKTPKGV